MFCFNHASAFYTNNKIVKMLMNNQFKAQSLNRKSYRKFTLSYFSVTCFKHVGCFDQSARSIESRCVTVNGANMGPIWGRQDPGGPHDGPMNFAIWDDMNSILTEKRRKVVECVDACHCVNVCVALIWRRHDMETFSALLTLCEGKTTINGGSHNTGQVIRALVFCLPLAWKETVKLHVTWEAIPFMWRHCNESFRLIQLMVLFVRDIWDRDGNGMFGNINIHHCYWLKCIA